MAELYNYKPIFQGKNQIDQLHKIFKVLGDPGLEGIMLNKSSD